MKKDPKDDLIGNTIEHGLDCAQERYRKPPVLTSLLGLHWTETQIAEYLDVTPAAVSHWLTGRNRINQKNFQGLIRLLETTVQDYESEIDGLRSIGQWSAPSAHYMRYRLSDAKGCLTRYRNWLERERLENAA